MREARGLNEDDFVHDSEMKLSRETRRTKSKEVLIFAQKINRGNLVDTKDPTFDDQRNSLIELLIDQSMKRFVMMIQKIRCT